MSSYFESQAYTEVASAVTLLKATYPDVGWYQFGNQIFGSFPGQRCVDLSFGKGGWYAAFWVNGALYGACHPTPIGAVQLAARAATSEANAQHERLTARIAKFAALTGESK